MFLVTPHVFSFFYLSLPFCSLLWILFLYESKSNQKDRNHAKCFKHRELLGETRYKSLGRAERATRTKASYPQIRNSRKCITPRAGLTTFAWSQTRPQGWLSLLRLLLQLNGMAHALREQQEAGPGGGWSQASPGPAGWPLSLSPPVMRG